MYLSTIYAPFFIFLTPICIVYLLIKHFIDKKKNKKD
jgi:hypothetical protein